MIPMSRQSCKIWCPTRESNSEDPVSKTGAYANSASGAWWIEVELNHYSQRREGYSLLGSPMPSRSKNKKPG